MNIKLNTGKTQVSVIANKSPELIITPEAYAFISELVSQAKEEVSWLSHISQYDNRLFVLDECFVVEQNVHPAQTEMTDNGLQELSNQILKSKGASYYNEIRLWGHSHVNMSPSPSGQDRDQIRKFSDQEWFIMLIINKSGDMHIEFHDNINGIKFTDIPVYLSVPSKNQATVKEQVSSEIKSKVKSAPIVHTFSNFDAPQYMNVQYFDKTKNNHRNMDTNKSRHNAQISMFDSYDQFDSYNQFNDYCSEKEFTNAKNLIKQIMDDGLIILHEDGPQFNFTSCIIEILENLEGNGLPSTTYRELLQEFCDEVDINKPGKRESEAMDAMVNYAIRNQSKYRSLIDFIEDYTIEPLWYESYLSYLGDITDDLL